MMFSVPVTEIMSMKIRAPRSLLPPVSAMMYPFSIRIFAPMDFRPLIVKVHRSLTRWRSPRGRDTSARPNRAVRGPSTKIEARMVFTRS